MSIPSYRDPFSQVDSMAPKRANDGRLFDRSAFGSFRGIMHEPWQPMLLGLQEWICELLVKNQQLRMTVMEMKARSRSMAAVQANEAFDAGGGRPGCCEPILL